MNQRALVYPWDDVAGYRGFGFSNTWDVFAKLSYKFLNNLKFNATYWQVANHMQSFSSRYTYWDEGKNELFRDTYRYTASINHSGRIEWGHTNAVLKKQGNEEDGARCWV